MGLWSSLISKLGGSPLPTDYYDKLLGLSPGETIIFSAGGFYAQTVDWKEFTRGVGYLLVMTSNDRLIMGDMQDPSLARPFISGSLRVEDRNFLHNAKGFTQGRGGRSQSAGPTGAMEDVKVLAFTPHQGDPFAIIVVESAVERIIDWCNGT